MNIYRSAIKTSEIRMCTYQLPSAGFLRDLMRGHLSRKNSGNPAQMICQHSCHQSAYKTENKMGRSPVIPIMVFRKNLLHSLHIFISYVKQIMGKMYVGLARKQANSVQKFSMRRTDPNMQLVVNVRGCL